MTMAAEAIDSGRALQQVSPGIFAKERTRITLQCGMKLPRTAALRLQGS